MNSKNNQSARQAFDIAKQVLFAAWIESFRKSQSGYPNLSPAGEKAAADACLQWVNSRKLSQGEVRLEVELNTANSVFTFGVTPTQQNSTGVVFNTENRLQLQDSLIVSEYGIFVAQPASRTDTAFRLRTYGNTQDFAAADAAALDETFYSNGGFQLRVNNDVIVPYRGLYNHWYKGQTQQTAALGAGSPGDEICGAEDGFITSEPNTLYIGSKNYQPQIVLPGQLASAAAFIRCILILRGVNAQNSTSIN